jgi:hypothetical protein
MGIRRTLLRSSILVPLLAISMLAAPAAYGAPPGVFVLDGAGGAGGRTTHAIGGDTASAVFDGDVFVFSQDATGGNLRVGRRTDVWGFRTLDGAGGVAGRIAADVGSDIAATTYGGSLHVLYADDTHGDLRHAWFDGTSWRFETLDGAGGGAGRVDATVGSGISVARAGGSLHVFYVDRTHTNVRHARFDGASWTFQTLDGAGGAGGRVQGDVGYATQAVVYGARLHAFYFFQDPFCDPDFGCRLFGSIREARLVGGAWHIRDIRDINCCFGGQGLAVTKVSNTAVFLAYQNFGLHSTNLRYLRWDGAVWTTDTDNGVVEEVPFDGEDVGDGVSALTVDGVAHLFFWGGFNFSGLEDGVREATWNGARWDVELIGVAFGLPTSCLVRGSHRLVFVGDATIPPDRFDGHDLVEARLA